MPTVTSGPGGSAFAVGSVVLLAVLLAGALDPAPASAQVIPIPGLKGLFDAAGDVADKLGARALQEALEWLLGGAKAAITLEFVKFLTTIELPVGGSLSKATGPILVVGGFFLVVGLITSVGDGYREIVAGTDTAPRVIGQAIFRVIGLALLLGSWFWIVPLAVDVANGMSQYVLSDDAVASALRRTFGAPTLTGFPLLGLLIGIFMAMAILTLVVLKFVIAIAFACLYVGGPALIGFAALPRVGALPLAIATRGLVTVTLIPLAWTIVFVAWAGVSAGMFDAAAGAEGGVIKALMGPGLFLAGLVVMLAVTKKLLSMATFGLRLSVPGGGVVRSVVTMTAGKAALGTLGAAIGSAAGQQGAGDSEPPPIKGGARQPRRVDSTSSPSGVQSATTIQRAGKPRKLFEGSPQSYWGERQEHRAWIEEAERAEQARDANALATGMRRGVWRSREAPRADYAVLGERVEELRTVWAEVPSELVREAGLALPAGDRSGFAAAAKTASENHPGDPGAAAAEFRHAGVSQYAGRAGMSVEQREAVASVLAAPPERAWDAFREDYERFQWREAGARTDPAGTGGGDPPRIAGYDPELFKFGRDGSESPTERR